MTALDWLIIVAYLTGMIALSIYLGRRQSDQDDYFVGGRKLSWWMVGLSTMATQTSAISFISIPAFVALKPGGGLTWLQYEMAVPLAIIVVMVFLIPLFRKLELVSVYEYLEHRYHPSVRTMVSFVFLLSRGLGTGVGVYASAIVLSVCLGTPLWATIILIGGVTIIYDTIGGITAVVYSDTIQMAVLLLGIALCIGFSTVQTGNLFDGFAAFPLTRRQAIDFSTGLGDVSQGPFWAFLLGGFFLYASYYGTDQSQVQRELSAESIKGTKLSLALNGFARFPFTVLYCVLGIAMWSVYENSPELVGSIPHNQPDYLVPQFILMFLPTGVRALIFAAILAAAMSSLDSALNSLSAATMRDFIEPRLGGTKRILQISKLTTVGWGILITGFAFLTGHISDTVIEGINKIGSAFYGPILAVFLVGVLSRIPTPLSVLIGIPIGVGFNLTLWATRPDIHWMWWNLFGFTITAGIGFLIGAFNQKRAPTGIGRFILDYRQLTSPEAKWVPLYFGLIGYFVLIVSLLISL
jgi:SSS family solute:Na+ symporter